MRIGAHCPNCKAGDANCKKNYVWLTNYVQNWRVNCATFYGVGVGAGATLVHTVAAYEKSLRFPEGLYIHIGGDEGDRTSDLLTASQALSQLSYAPVTGGYYRGRSPLAQGLFWVDLPPYGFSLDYQLHPNTSHIHPHMCG